MAAADDFIPTPPTPATFSPTKNIIAPPVQDDFVPLQQYMQAHPGPSIRDSSLEFVRPLAADTAEGLGTAASGLTGPLGPAAGFMSAGLVDALLQHLESKPPVGLVSQAAGFTPGGIESTLANTAEMIGGGKLINAAVSPLMRGASNFVRGLSPAAPMTMQALTQGELEKLSPTFSQYLNPDSKLAQMSKFVEDTFARNAKQKAQTNSAQLGAAAGKQMAADMSGRTIEQVTNPETHSQLAQMAAQYNQTQLKNAFNKFAAESKFYKPDFAVSTPEFAPGSTSPLSYTLKEIPQDGSRLLVKPKSWSDSAWKQYNQNPQQFIAQTNTWTANPNVSPLKQINKNYDPVKYQNALENATAVTKLHDSLFNEKGLKGLVNDPNNSAVPFLDDIIKDPQKLERALASSSLPIPGSAAITTDTLRGDLRGYQLNKLIDSASTRDISGKITAIDPKKLSAQFTDPKMADSMKQLYSQQQRADITQLFTNLAKTQQKMGAGFATGSKLFLGASGLEMAASLLSGNMKWGLVGAVPQTIRLGGYALGKIMTNPTLARAMSSAAAGQPMNLAQKTIARELSNVLNGAVVSLVDSTGKETSGKIQQGEFVPVATQHQVQP